MPPIRIDALIVDPEGSGFEALTQNVSARSAGCYGLCALSGCFRSG